MDPREGTSEPEEDLAAADTEVEDSGAGTDNNEEVEDQSGVDESGQDDAGDGEGESGGGRRAGSDPRIDEAIRRSEAAERRAEAAEREARELRQTRTEDSQRMTERERAEKLSKMTPEERVTFIANEASARLDYSTRMAEFRNADMADRSEFISEISSHPKLMAFKDIVEQRLQQLRETNKQTVPRKIMLYHVLGEAAVKAVLKGAGKKQKDSARTRVESQRTNATQSARGTMNGSTRQAGKSSKDRLANVVF